MDADAFVQFLPVAAGLDRFHEDFLGGHEGEFGGKVFGDDFGVDDKSRRHVVAEFQNRVGGEKRLRQRQPAVGGIVKGALKPLGGMGQVAVLRQADKETRQRAYAFRSHGIALIRHGGGADLLFFKRFLDFPAVGEEADVGGEFGGAFADAGEDGKDLRIEFAGIGLSGDG